MNIVGWVICPLVTIQQLEYYFERLKNKGIVKYYFLKQIRRHRITYTISTENYKPEKEIFKRIMNSQEKNITKIETLDVTYDITKYRKQKKQLFEKEILTFLAALLSRSLGKSIYIWRPFKLIYDLCIERNVYTADTKAVKYYMNQLERRLRRLKLIKYFLYFRDPVAFGTALYLEIKEKIENIKLQQFIEKLERIAEIVIVTFNDRTILYFPQLKYDTVFREFLEEQIQLAGFEFSLFQITHNKDWEVPYNQLYHESFDYKTQQWSFL